MQDACTRQIYEAKLIDYYCHLLICGVKELPAVKKALGCCSSYQAAITILYRKFPRISTI